MFSNNYTETVSGRYGSLYFFNSDVVIGRSLKLYGEWAENEIAFLRRFIRPSDTVIDVGANIGTHTLAFLNAVGEHGRVHAFEPRPEIFTLLEGAVRANSPSNAVLHPAAVGQAEGTLFAPTLQPADSANFGGLSLLREMKEADGAGPPRDGAHAVPITTIDALKLDACRLIKIDVEGAEAAVLEGARGTIAQFHPALYAECNSVESGLAVKSFYDSIGYQAFMHVADAFNPGNFFGATENIFGEAREAALLGLHPDEAAQMDLVETGGWLLPVDGADAITFALLQKPQFFREVLEPSVAGQRFRQLTGRRGDPQDKVDRDENARAAWEQRIAASEARAEREALEKRAVLRHLDHLSRHPWQPLIAWLSCRALNLLSVVTAPFSREWAQRFTRSARKRDPRNFDTHLTAEGADERESGNVAPSVAPPVTSPPQGGDVRLTRWLAQLPLVPKRLQALPLRDFAAAVFRHPVKPPKQRLFVANRARRRAEGHGQPRPTLKALRSSRARSLPVRRAQNIVLTPYLTVHPDLEGEEHPTLDASVSVVIPTYNAGQEFDFLLRKLRSQKGLRSVEIVVVDSGSSDGTTATAAAFGCNLVTIAQSEFSHSHARNLGAAAASGDYLVFMVQDAYPIGEHWLYGLVRCLADHQHGDGLAALSCAEYPRSDSELFYDSLIKIHYDFLGCSEGDGLGRLTGDDHVALRTQGQLSDVTCLIPKALFDRYKYEGDFAEDLILGIKLIRDGYRVAMLSSIRVIHSHRRPVTYYLRRSFVDVAFLTGIFADFVPPPCNGLAGSLTAAAILSTLTPDLSSDPLRSPLEALEDFIGKVRQTVLPEVASARWDGFGFPALVSWLDSYYAQPSPAPDSGEAALRHASFEQTRNMYADRLAALETALRVYPALDETVCRELGEAIIKTLAMTIGSQLCFCCIAPPHEQGMDEQLRTLRALLSAGV